MSTCPCGRTPDPGINPGGGCRCVGIPERKPGAAVYIVMLVYPYESASPWAVYSTMEMAAACVAEGGNPFGSYLEVFEMQVDESLPQADSAPPSDRPASQPPAPFKKHRRPVPVSPEDKTGGEPSAPR